MRLTDYSERESREKMRVIGITGGVGAGKSMVLHFLEEEYQARVLEADKVGHFVMEPGQDCYREIVEIFGREILREDGTIDRGKLGGIVFGNREKLQLLNQVVHPAVKSWIRRELEQEKDRGQRELCVIEAALLIEDHYQDLCQEFWYLYASEAVREERLKSSRGYTEEKIRAIFASQQSEESFRLHCQAVIDNNGSKEETKEQVRRLLRERGVGLGKGEQER